MGHRHLFNTSQMFENEQDQNWNQMHIEQPFANLDREGPADNGSFFYPAENMPVDGVHFTSQWNPSLMSNTYISSNQNVEVSYYQPDASGPSHDPFLHPTAGTFCTVPENHARHPSSSSSYDRQPFHGVESGLVDLTGGNVRGLHKRKSPGVPSACEGSSTTRCYGASSSSDPPHSSELRQEKPNLDPQYMGWECFTMTPGHRGNLSIRPESAVRNVRNRPALDLESNLARTHLSRNSSHNSYPVGRHFEHSSSIDFSGQRSNALSHDWSHSRISPASGRMLMPDNNGYSHEANHFFVGSSVANASVDVRRHPHDFISSRNPVVHQSHHGSSAHSARGIRSSYSQRPNPTFRASSSNLRSGHVSPSDDSMQLVAENFPSRQPRLSSTIAWRNSDMNRSRVSYDRYRSVSNEPGLHDRFSSEGYMVLDRSTYSRNMFDQHRDMRLDVDEMSYEELLALGERIGCVSTGLSEDLISKCLTEKVYCSPGQSQDEGNCVICLEEYKEMDDVGSLKNCGHEYHVSCIKKWLSMKNSCPICKAAAMSDDMKQ